MARNSLQLLKRSFQMRKIQSRIRLYRITVTHCVFSFLVISRRNNFVKSFGVIDRYILATAAFLCYNITVMQY